MLVVPYVFPAKVHDCRRVPPEPRGPYSGKPSAIQPICGECEEVVWPSCCSRHEGGTWQWYEAEMLVEAWHPHSSKV